MEINWKAIPVHKIICANLESPRDISKYFEKYKIDYYVYEIVCANTDITDVVKYGMSADKSRDYGERLYRQIGHCKSWGTKRIWGANGADLIAVNELWNNVYKADINHKDLILTVFDLSHYTFVSTNQRAEIFAIEESLISKFEQRYNRKPIGNLLELYSYKDRAYLERARVAQLFDLE